MPGAVDVLCADFVVPHCAGSSGTAPGAPGQACQSAAGGQVRRRGGACSLKHDLWLPNASEACAALERLQTHRPHLVRRGAAATGSKACGISSLQTQHLLHRSAAADAHTRLPPPPPPLTPAALARLAPAAAPATCSAALLRSLEKSLIAAAEQRSTGRRRQWTPPTCRSGSTSSRLWIRCAPMP